MHHFLKNIDQIIEAPNGIEKLRQTVLQLAVQGKLVAQDPNDEPATELLKRIKAEKEKLFAEGKIKKQVELPSIKDDEKPFELPKGWDWVRFQNITSVITCGMASTPSYAESGRIFLSAKNVKPYRFLPHNYKFVSEETYRKIIQNAKPEINDILLTRVGAGIGEACIIDQEIEFGYYVSLTLIKPIHKFINSEYLLHYLSSPFGIQNAITNTYGIGVSQGNLNVNQVRKYIIPIPPQHEQIQIVQKVNELMKLIDELEKKKEIRDHKKIALNNSSIDKLLRSKTEEEKKQNWKTINTNFNTLYSVKENVVKLKQAILQLAVQGKLVEQNLTDEPVSELLKRIKADKVKLLDEGKIKKQPELPPIKEEEKPFELPKTWELVRLGEVTNYGNNLKTDGSGIDKNTWVLDLEDIEKTSSRLLRKIRYSEKQFQSSKTIFNKGDVIYGKLRPYLDKVLVADEEGVCTTEMIPIRGYLDIDPFFLRWVLKSPYFIEYANSSTHGMNLPRFGTDKARLATIPLCSLAEQKRIVEKVNELMSFCNKLEQSLTLQKVEQEKLVNSILSITTIKECPHGA